MFAWGKLGIGAVGVGIAVAAFFLLPTSSQEDRRYSALNLEPMTANEVSEQFYNLAPEMLTQVYLAFNETDEGAIYDMLAEVAAEEALETLYLERVGAMAENGLDASEEADQQIHTMEMLRIRSQQDGTTFEWDARWRVVGTVGHATHMHVRGNIYAANLTVSPVNGAWRITGFQLTDVDRTEAGQMVEAQP